MTAEFGLRQRSYVYTSIMATTPQEQKTPKLNLFPVITRERCHSSIDHKTRILSTTK